MTDVVVANKDFLDDMDEDTRTTFRKLMKESMEVEFEAWDQNIEDAKAGSGRTQMSPLWKQTSKPSGSGVCRCWRASPTVLT